MTEQDKHPQNEEPAIVCKELTIGYHEGRSVVTVKRNLSLQALNGEMVALIGGNGVGKSTLLKTIAGFQPPVAGELKIRGRSVLDIHAGELAKIMGFVSTEIVRVTNLTVGELVGLGRFPHTNWMGQLDEADKKIISEAIRLTGLPGYENRQVSRISDGERQRVMIARALAQDTPIIVLDEPTAFLDLANRYEVVHLLHRLANEQGKCILFSTHDLSIALTLADRLWMMLDDRMVEGIPEEVAAGGHFESLFPNNHQLIFDPEKGDFRLPREIKGKIMLSATGKEQQLATKALERIGFDVELFSPDAKGSLSQNDDCWLVFQKKSGWELSHRGMVQQCRNLSDLCRTVKGIKLQP